VDDASRTIASSGVSPRFCGRGFAHAALEVMLKVRPGAVDVAARPARERAGALARIASVGGNLLLAHHGHAIGQKRLSREGITESTRLGAGRLRSVIRTCAHGSYGSPARDSTDAWSG
jgi:hypothetical protein